MQIPPWFLFLPVLGYLSGSLSFAYWVTRLLKGVDVRAVGSQHATTTNTIRQVGFGVGVIVGILDIAKGFLPVFIAVWLGAPDWLVGLTVAAAVAGHCWPLFSGFKGGMGLAAMGGGFLAIEPLAFAIALAFLIALTLILKHGARASVILGLTIAPILYLFDLTSTIIWAAALAGPVVAIRFMIDWRRKYRELWLDREMDGTEIAPDNEEDSNGGLT